MEIAADFLCWLQASGRLELGWGAGVTRQYGVGHFSEAWSTLYFFGTKSCVTVGMSRVCSVLMPRGVIFVVYYRA